MRRLIDRAAGVILGPLLSYREWLRTYFWFSHEPRRVPQGFLFTATASQPHREMQEGRFEAEEAAAFARELAECEVFIDVGANVGYYTCMACALGKRVIAFEPLAYNLRFLYENLRINGWQDRAEVLPLGVGARPGFCDLFGASSTGASVIQGWAGASARTRETISINTLDAMVAGRCAGRRLLVKLDIEGGEHAAVQGAAALLRLSPAPTWLVEITLHQFHPQGKNPHFAETFALFFASGYQAWTADEARRPVTPADVKAWDAAGSIPNRQYNFLFKR